MREDWVNIYIKLVFIFGAMTSYRAFGRNDFISVGIRLLIYPTKHK